MSRWLTSTLFASLSLAPLSLAGCLVHERPGDEVDAAVWVDTWLEARDGSALFDAAASPDAGAVSDAGAPTCSLDETSVAVRIEPVTLDTARCTFTHAEGASLTGVEPSVADDGIRVHFDLCPTADADCRCDIVVSNVGTDIAHTLGPDGNVTIDVRTGEGFTPGAFVSITKVPSCECDTCGCSEPLYLYAANETPNPARVAPAPMAFSVGSSVCPMADCTFGGSSMLHARGDVGEADVPGGTQVELGSVHVRSVRDVEVWAPCAACAECGSPIGAWIAWITSAPPTP